MIESKTKIVIDAGSRIMLSVFETASELGVSEQLIRAEIARGRLSATRVGKRILIPRARLDQYLAEQAIQS